MHEVPAFVGNGHYCYANVTAMLLNAVGERVPPGLVEVVSGVGLGAIWLPGPDLYFFGSSAPDQGITRALDVLGIAAVETAADDGADPPVAELVEALGVGPAILGPLDMGLLNYSPGRGAATGIDHFVLAYETDGNEVYLHDPAGFPCVSLPVEGLIEAWRADKIPYRRGAFRWWRSPRRVAARSDDEIRYRALIAFATVYQDADAAAAAGATTGGAIRHLAERAASADLSPAVISHLARFAFQVGARRALDYADFFAAWHATLADAKRQQAALFGRCQTLLVRGDWDNLTRTLRWLADVEDQFRADVARSSEARYSSIC